MSSDGVTDPLTGQVRAGNDTNWILAADAATAPTVACGYLPGERNPAVRQSELIMGEWGLAWDIHLALAVAAFAYHGIVWSDGQ